jgi:hypothetical protein
MSDADKARKLRAEAQAIAEEKKSGGKPFGGSGSGVVTEGREDFSKAQTAARDHIANMKEEEAEVLESRGKAYADGGMIGHGDRNYGKKR